MQTHDVANHLLTRLSPYLPEACTQILATSPSLRDISPSPYEVLAYKLTSAVLSIGIRYSQYRSKVAELVSEYVAEWTDAASSLSADKFEDDDRVEFTPDSDLVRVMTLSMSLLGFLNAAGELSHFWTPYEQLQLVESIQTALTEKFLITFETALSVVRNNRYSQHGLREWKRYTKCYAAAGQPLGAMILHNAFLKVATACATSLVRKPGSDANETVLDYLRSSHRKGDVLRATAEDALAEGLSQIAVQEIERLENDMDYLQRVGSAWQQHLAAAVKAKVLTSFLCCAVYNQEIADPDVLMTWLDTTLNDPVQIADPALASTVLKSISVLAKLSPSLATVLGRSLPRTIVQGRFDSQTATIAADCLAAVLSCLPQDASITTLYSLGNVLSADAVPENNASASPSLNGAAKATRSTGVYSHQAAGSAISLVPSDIDEPTHVYTTVVQTIGSIARSSKDEKIIALALSMLGQKIGRASKLVDAKIVAESARLGICSGPNELRLLLKLYNRLSQDALLKDDKPMLQAVSYS